MSIQNMGKSAMRVSKNYIKGYTDTQVKVRQATSNDAWGPSGQLMNEIAQLSYNQNDFIEIMEILDKRLNDKGRNWRHVFKSLTLIDYLLHAGSENCILYFRDNIYIVKTLKEFQHIDEDGKDQGANVRQKAKEVTSLLQDDTRLRAERAGRSSMRDRMLDRDPSFNSAPPPPQRIDPRVARRNKEDEDLRRAIEESKRSYRQNEERLRAEATDEEELQRALELSRQEEEARIRELEERNRNALFDDNLAQPLVDVSGAQNATLQPQYTSFNPYLQQQQTGWNPYLQQQMQEQAALQAQWQQQQAEQQRQWELQQAAQQYQAIMMGQQQQQQQQMQMQPIQPQATAVGSRNPFAAQPQAPAPQMQPQSQPQQMFSAPAPAPAPAANPSPAPPSMQQSASPAPVRVDQSGKFDELNRLLAQGDGVDTFGNTGDQRLGHGQGRSNLMTTQQHNAQMGQQAFQNAFGNSAPPPTQTEQPFFQL